MSEKRPDHGEWDRESAHRDDAAKEVRIKDAPGSWHRDVCQGIVMAYFLVMTVIYPFYAPGGYTRIGETKYEFFRGTGLITAAVMIVVLLLSILTRHDSHWIFRACQQMTVADWFAYGYFVAVLISYLCSPYKKDALWGARGWYMGVVTQVILVLIYFAFSRYYHCSAVWIGVWLSAAAAVFMLGICNRYSVYPVTMEGSTETFISTLGNVNWFCGYWSVTAPVGIAIYWCTDRTWIRILSAVYSVVAVLSGMTQGSSSACIVFGVTAALLFYLSVRLGRLLRFLELCLLFASGCLLGNLMGRLPRLRLNYLPDGEDLISRIIRALTVGNAAFWLLGTVGAVYVLIRTAQRKGLLCRETPADGSACRRLGKVPAAAFLTVCFGILLLGTARGAFSTARDAAAGNGVYKAVFAEDWGNGRGTAYNCGISAYAHMNGLHKMFGIGPDCFSDYVYDIPEVPARLADQFENQRLTNAHNEWLTILVNTGALGLICYAGLFASVLVRCLKGAPGQPVLYLCAVSILAYTAHNMVSFQQVLNTPLAFIMLGIGERFCRSAERKDLYE